jgi:hypothetical protein|tara:strand:- start:26 stop:469 length:444 start_codon:yes stop_codon:yes gene_type:complete
MARMDHKQNLLNVDDMTVVNTLRGWILRIRRGVKWFSTPLYEDTIGDKDVFIPKCWHKRGVTSSGTAAFTIKLPSFITVGNILAFNVMINFHASSKFLYFWAWDTPTAVSDNNGAEFYYDRVNNRVVLDERGSNSTSKDYRLTVFFK